MFNLEVYIVTMFRCNWFKAKDLLASDSNCKWEYPSSGEKNSEKKGSFTNS